VALFVGLGISWRVASELVRPRPRTVGDPPADFEAETVRIPSDSGSVLAGWYAPRPDAKGAVLLLHGFQATRLQMLDHASPTMWAIGGVLVVIVVDVTILFLIVRDVLEDKANPLHWIGSVVAWIGLAFLAEGFKALARALHATEGRATESDFDLWISTALTVILLAFTPSLILLGLVVGRICWKIHQERRAATSARRLRGTLSRR